MQGLHYAFMQVLKVSYWRRPNKHFMHNDRPVILNINVLNCSLAQQQQSNPSR